MPKDYALKSVTFIPLGVTHGDHGSVELTDDCAFPAGCGVSQNVAVAPTDISG